MTGAVREPAGGGDAEPPWLPLLREMHRVVDEGVAAAVRREEKRRKARLACRRGCTVCCRSQSDIPVLPLELAGISWFCAERLAGAARESVRARCAGHATGGECPFLADGACAVYPVRPIACRLFNVLGVPCAEGEDAWATRPRDVLEAPPGLLPRAYRVMLPFHGVADPADQEQWLARGLVRTLVRNLPRVDWRSLARLMGERAGRPGGDGPAPG